MGEPKEYKGIVWPRAEDDKTPGRRFVIWASTPSEASRLAKEQFGEYTIISLWNEKDANTIR